MTAFADTSYFIALLGPTDFAHDLAEEFSKSVNGIVTTEWILLELADGLADTGNRHLFTATRDTVYQTAGAEVVPLDMDLHARAIDLYENRHDKEWSLTDCVSFIVMTDRKLHEALTTDHHFEQAGFVALLK